MIPLRSVPGTEIGWCVPLTEIMTENAEKSTSLQKAEYFVIPLTFN